MPDCSHCQQELRSSQYNANRTLKSCPNCSGNNGVEHVYYAYPDAFGTTDLRASGTAPDGPQSYCTACRGGHPPTATATLCSAI